MASKKKSKVATVDHSSADESDLEWLKEFANLFYETIQEETQINEDSDAFDSYILKIKSHIYTDQQKFNGHFVRGYHSLLDEISKKTI